MNDLKEVLHIAEKLQREIESCPAIPPAKQEALLQNVSLSGTCLINALETMLKVARGESVDMDEVYEKTSWLQKHVVLPSSEPVQLSVEVQKLLWRHSLRPLIETVIEKIKRFKTQFANVSFVAVVDGVETSGSDEVVTGVIERQFAHNNHLADIKLMCSFRQALDPKVRIYSLYYVPLQMILEPYRYTISSENRLEMYRKSYAQQLNHYEIEKIADGVVAAINEKIGKQTV